MQSGRRPVAPGCIRKACTTIPLKPYTLDAQAIDVLALHLPSKHVLPEALAYAAGAIRSPDPLQRAAACTAIVDVAEGCADAVRKQLPTVLQVRGGTWNAPKHGRAAIYLPGHVASHSSVTTRAAPGTFQFRKVKTCGHMQHPTRCNPLWLSVCSACSSSKHL